MCLLHGWFCQQWETGEEGSWLREYPVTLLQFLLFLYHNHASFMHMCMAQDFLSALAATLFPYRHTGGADGGGNSENTTPLEECKVRVYY